MNRWGETQQPRDPSGRFASNHLPEADPEVGFGDGTSGEEDLSAEEILDVQLAFGVEEQQVRRDYAISHALAAISSIESDRITFFGGTALTRTYLPDLRLSEDIDLIATGRRAEVAEEIQYAIESHINRKVGQSWFDVDLSKVRHPHPATLQTPYGPVQIQLLSSTGYPSWPTEHRIIEQRYSAAPPATMNVLTPSAFAASKLMSYGERNAPRDLYDMWAMAGKGFIDGEAAALFRKHGPFSDVRGVSFSQPPSTRAWANALEHQCIVEVTPREAAEVVRDAWEQAWNDSMR